MRNWAMCKKVLASARFFLRSGGIHLYGFLLIPRYNHDKIIGRIQTTMSKDRYPPLSLWRIPLYAGRGEQGGIAPV